MQRTINEEKMKFNYTLLILLVGTLLSCSGNNYRNMEGQEAEIPAAAIRALESEEDLDVLLNQIGDARIVLLGESSHGTSEFYTWRAAISKRLIEQKGFDMIAVEADWEDAYAINKFIRGTSQYTTATDALQEFDRWPEWMWANREIADFTEWLRTYNMRSDEADAGFYGLDVYGIWESLDAVTRYLDENHPGSLELAHAVRDCFEPYQGDESAYARATLDSSVNCEPVISALYEAIEALISEDNDLSREEFNLLQNAAVVANAETYYRTAVRSNATSWNVRDLHMMGTINRLLEQEGPDSRIIVWEHNTHVGDARATDMADAGMVNVGQLVREEYGEDHVHITGFGTYRGEVLAAPQWGARSRVMRVPRAMKNSWEWILHQHAPADKIILMNQLSQNPYYQQRIGHRAIGVVYDPDQESGNYVPSVLPERYDTFIFIDESDALQPLD